jgi:GAF domain-containing protein
LTLLTTAVNLVGLAFTLGLGLYLVTRSVRSRLAWLAALTLWCATGFFLHNVLLLHLPGGGLLPLLRPVAVLALPFGFHLLLLLPPSQEPPSRDFYQPALELPQAVRRTLGALAEPLSRLVVPLTYTLGLALALGGAFPLGLPPGTEGGPGLYLSGRATTPLYPAAVAFLAILGALAGMHLWLRRNQAASPAQQRRFRPLFAALGLAVLGGLYLSLGVALQLDLPGVPGDLAVGVAASLLGLSVARHNARVEGRDVKRDLLYIALTIGSFTVVYVLVAEFLYLGGHHFSTLTVVLIVVVAVSSLMLYDGLRTALDRLFYREQFRQLRANLRALAREAGIGQSLPERLQSILAALCAALQIRRGLVALREGDLFVCRATERALPVGQTYAAPLLEAEEIVDLPRPGQAGPEGLVLLVPLHAGEEQIGALVLGAREADQPYSEEDRLLLDDLAEQVATVIQATRFQEANAQAISDMVAEFREREHSLQRQMQEVLAEREVAARPVLAGVGEKQFVSLVEDALRRLHDYPYLGEHALARLRVVDHYLAECEEEVVTHLDRGKALSQVLTQALDKLRPPGTEPGPHDVPPREWHSYLILHGAYVRGALNRDLMSWLYVGEGTFNRTRRRAVRAVAKALQEMEQAGPR